MLGRPSLSRVLAAALIIAIVAIACTDASTKPLMTPVGTRFYEDSNPTACGWWNCRELEEGEYNDLYAGLYAGFLGALAAQDLECYNLFVRGMNKMDYGRVYIGRQLPPNAPGGTIGGWDVVSPNEIYIMEGRFLTSIGSAINTMLHETNHDYYGPKPTNRGIDSWENQMQTGATSCEGYAQ